ncbi:MAG: adenylate kinase [Deltaproteobacteria bacterium]|nr:adenylate kinase [Deltaproteobacteria bacterium]MDZ4347056.1 adenylate kinase [Candidatus Binatia bacterium]
MAAGARVVLLGPPGAGKGTQGKLLEEKFAASQISTGDILRKAVAEQGDLGKQASEYIHRGELVPDKLIIDLVAERLKEKDCDKGFVLDGFPRTLAQAQSLEEILKRMGLALNCVFSLQVPHELIVERLSGRRTCKGCGALYHVVFDPPKAAGTCNRCGGELLQRDDDRAETISNRLKVYDNQTAPLVSYYRERGLLKSIDGVGKVEDIGKRVIQALGDVAA